MGKVKASLEALGVKRLVRRRRDGDGLGVDIGIAGGFYGLRFEHALTALTPDTKAKLHDHVAGHVAEAMRPLLKLAQKSGASELDLEMLASVGPNCLRTILEALEEKIDTGRRQDYEGDHDQISA